MFVIEDWYETNEGILANIDAKYIRFKTESLSDIKELEKFGNLNEENKKLFDCFLDTIHQEYIRKQLQRICSQDFGRNVFRVRKITFTNENLK